MALQISGAAQLKLYYSVNSTLVINVMGAIITGNPIFNQALANTIGSAIKGNFAAGPGPLMPSTSILARVGLRDLRQPNLPEFRDTGATAAGSGAASDALPPGLAICLTLRTAGSGKSFRGRTYISGWNEAQNTASGAQAVGAATAAINYVNFIDTTLKGSGMALGVLSYPSEKKVLTETTFHTDGSSTVRVLSTTKAKTGSVNQVTSVENRQALWEHQRRRDNGRGVPPTAFLTPPMSVQLVDL